MTRIAELFNKLMLELGYHTYVAQRRRLGISRHKTIRIITFRSLQSDPRQHAPHPGSSDIHSGGVNLVEIGY